MDAYLELMKNKEHKHGRKKVRTKRRVRYCMTEKLTRIFSNFNITDEVAERLLKANPKLAAQFRKLPEAKPSGEAVEDVILDAGRADQAGVGEMLREQGRARKPSWRLSEQRGRC